MPPKKSIPLNPAAIFEYYADKLIPIVSNLTSGDEYIHHAPAPGRRFGFRYQRDYSGTMASPKKKRFRKDCSHLGLFDIFVISEGRYDGKSVSHRLVFEDLKAHSTEAACLRVWRGEDPKLVGSSEDEKEALTVMSLLMFEQEINWGKEIFQKWTNFPPRPTKPSLVRPRDMMMGFVRQAFVLDSLDEMKYWQGISGDATPTFNERGVLKTGYKHYPPEWKRYFEELKTMNPTDAVMVGARRTVFVGIAQSSKPNPRYSPTAPNYYKQPGNK